MNVRFCSPGKLLPYLLYFSILFLLLWCWKPASAQGRAEGRLSVGDRVPDVVARNVLHYKGDSLRLSDFKGKLLILDFWATWCGPCSYMIPRMDSLQKQFEGKVQFVSVAYQSRKEVTTYLDRLARLKGWRISIPEVVADTVLKNLFQPTGYPHYIWIDASGTLRAATTLEEVKASNIAALLAGKNPFSSALATAPAARFKPSEGSLGDFLSQHQFSYAAQYSSFFSSYIQGLKGGYHAETKEDPSRSWRISVTNLAPLWLFKFAFGEGANFFGDRFVAKEVKEPALLESHLEGEAMAAWIQKHTVCYELILPFALREKRWEIFRQDLQRMFPQYQATVEKRSLDALVLVRTSSEDKLKSKSAEFSNRKDALSLNVRKGTLKNFVRNLNLVYMADSPLPIIDQTGYTGEIDMDLEANMSDVQSLNKALSHYDLRFVEKQTEIDILVIRDNPFFTSLLK